MVRPNCPSLKLKASPPQHSPEIVTQNFKSSWVYVLSLAGRTLFWTLRYAQMFTYSKIEALSPQDNISASYQFPPPATCHAEVLFQLTCQEFRAKHNIFHGGITAGKFPNKCPEFSQCPERGQRYLFFFPPVSVGHALWMLAMTFQVSSPCEAAEESQRSVSLKRRWD